MAQVTYSLSGGQLALPVWIGLDEEAANDMRVAGMAVTPSVLARGIIDTGADVTVIAPGIARRLGLLRAHVATSQTASGQVPVNLYWASLGIQGARVLGGFEIMLNPILVSDALTPIPNVDVLVGVSDLVKGKLFLDGPAMEFTLEF